MRGGESGQFLILYQMSAVLQRQRYSDVVKLAFPDIGLESSKFMVMQSNPFLYLPSSLLSISSYLFFSSPIRSRPYLYFSLAEGHWLDMANRKSFFDGIAQANGFDPLIPQNWYSSSYDKITEAKVTLQISLIHFRISLMILMQGYLVLQRVYKNNFVLALMHVYPDIGLDPNKFPFSPKGMQLSTSPFIFMFLFFS